jgi:threonine dehydrogenase-like Zn-dependent dehydrogenase
VLNFAHGALYMLGAYFSWSILQLTGQFWLCLLLAPVGAALAGGPAQVDLDGLTLKEIQLLGAFAHNHATWEKTLELMEQGRLDVSPIISGEFPLEQWSRAFEAAGRGEGLKYLLRPGE